MFWSNWSDFDPGYGLGLSPYRLRSVRSLQNQLHRLFDSLEAESPDARYPSVNVYNNPEKVVVTMELPGINAADLDVSVLGKILTVSGARKQEPLAEGEKLITRERGFGEFKRSIELPYAVDAEKVEAGYVNGILSVSLPRAGSDRPKKIAIK